MITLKGVIYLTNSLSIMHTTPSQYQTLSMSGHSSIQINGMIVISALSAAGASRVQFNRLSAAPGLPARMVALIK